jgi:hypothetical protein
MPAASRLWLSFLLVFVALTARRRTPRSQPRSRPPRRRGPRQKVGSAEAPGPTGCPWTSRPRPAASRPTSPLSPTPACVRASWAWAGRWRASPASSAAIPWAGCPMTLRQQRGRPRRVQLPPRRPAALPQQRQTGCYEAEQQDGRCVEYDDEANVWTVRKDGWRWTYGSRLVEEPSDDGIIIDILEWLFGGQPRGERLRAIRHLGPQPIHCVDGPTGSDVPTHLGESSAWLLTEVREPLRADDHLGLPPVGLRRHPRRAGDSEIGGNAQGAPLPERITYGAAEITFEYEPRDDWRIDGLGGSFVALTERLVAVEASVNESFYSRFTVNYADDPDLSTRWARRPPGPARPQQPLSIVTTIQRESSSGAFGASRRPSAQ